MLSFIENLLKPRFSGYKIDWAGLKNNECSTSLMGLSSWTGQKSGQEAEFRPRFFFWRGK